MIFFIQVSISTPSDVSFHATNINFKAAVGWKIEREFPKLA
jgi:hypothetical protein